MFVIARGLHRADKGKQKKQMTDLNTYFDGLCHCTSPTKVSYHTEPHTFLWWAPDDYHFAKWKESLGDGGGLLKVFTTPSSKQGSVNIPARKSGIPWSREGVSSLVVACQHITAMTLISFMDLRGCQSDWILWCMLANGNAAAVIKNVYFDVIWDCF